jgi:CRP/FNR family transcriptional regulator
MPVPLSILQTTLASLGSALLGELSKHAELARIPAGTGILKEGQYVKVIPIVLQGVVKVFAGFEDRELLLYYISPRQSCIMSFSAGFTNDPSRISAVTEEDSELLLLPVEKLQHWIRTYPQLNELFYAQYHLRYAEMLDTINSLLFVKLDHRLYSYLSEKSRLKGEPLIHITHRQIAAEMGTAREVITRVMKRLEQEGKIRQLPNGIQICG